MKEQNNLCPASILHQPQQIENLPRQSGSSSSKNIQTILFYMISVIVICLTAFNFYLFCWIWSSLNGSGGSLLRSTNHWAKMDLVGSYDKIEFIGKLASRHWFQVDQVSGPLRESSNVMNQMEQIEQKENLLEIKSKNLIQFKQSNNHISVLELDAKSRQIHFPAGLSLRGLGKMRNKFNEHNNNNNNDNANLTVLNCSPNDNPLEECQIFAPNIRLTNERGIDFTRGTIQVNQIETNRLHSATNSLNLFSTNLALFGSKNDKIELVALEDIKIVSRNSMVILNSSKIHLFGIQSAHSDSQSSLSAHSNKIHRQKVVKLRKELAYKVCICLRSFNDDDDDDRSKSENAYLDTNTNLSDSQTTKQHTQNNTNAFQFKMKHQQQKLMLSKNVDGLIFAIKSHLNCLKFDSFCNNNNNNNNQ